MTTETKPGVLRCERTNNPCGTDTYKAGERCQCAPCKEWQVEFDRRRRSDMTLFDLTRSI